MPEQEAAGGRPRQAERGSEGPTPTVQRASFCQPPRPPPRPEQETALCLRVGWVEYSAEGSLLTEGTCPMGLRVGKWGWLDKESSERPSP